MSGHIRKRVGVTRENVRRQVRDCPDFSVLTDSTDPSIRTEQLEESLFNIMLNKQKITNSVKELTELDDQWLRIIESMQGNDRAKEEDEYETVATHGYQPVLNEARDKVAYLQVKLIECNMHIADVHGGTQNNQMSPAMHDSRASPVPPVQQTTFAPPIHLPKMDLRDLCISFDGTARQFTAFMDSFMSFVHSQNIADVVKLNYLRSCLKGRALNAIKGLPMTKASYSEALDIMKARFGDPSSVKEELYVDFRKMPKVVSLADLSKFCDRLDETLRLLRTLNEDPDKSGFNPVLVPMMKEKLPPDILKEVESTGSVCTLGGLRDVLYQVYQIRERCARITKVDNNDNKNNSKQTHNRQNNGRNNNNDRSVFSVQVNQPKKNYEHKKQTGNKFQSSQTGFSGRSSGSVAYPCMFCDQQHMATDCRKYATTEARLERLMEKRCCFRCGRQNHMRARCVAKLFCQFCKGPHLSSLCFQQFGTPSSIKNRSNASASTQSSYGSKSIGGASAQSSKSATVATVTEEMEQSKGPTAALMIVSAYVHNPEAPANRVQAQVFLDPGAQRTFVTRELKEKLKLTAQQQETLNIYGFGPKPSNLPTERVNLTLELATRGQFVDGTFDFSANSVPSKYIRHPQTRPTLSSDDIEKLRSCSDVHVESEAYSSRKVRPDILIGAEYFWDLVEGEAQSLPSGLKVIPTKLGSVLSGANRTSSNMVISNSITVFSVNEAQDDDEEKIPELSALQPESNMDDFSRLWMMQNAPPLSGHDHNDEEVARKFFKETTMIEDGRVKVRFPMKNKDVIPSDNTELSLHRFRGLAKRFLQNPELYETYRKQIRDYLAEGILEYAPMDKSEMTSYLPHHAVLKEGSSTKCRIVFDASAKPARDPNARSVNECLYKGPVRPPSIQRMLIEFGLHPHACISDIQQAFLQLLLNEKDRGLTQLYWFKDDEHPERVDDNLVVLQFTRVLFGVISSPYLLEEAVQLILSQSDTDLDKRIARCIYVDNVVLGMMSEEQVFEYFRHSKELFQKYKMNMRQYLSSSSKFNEQLQECDRTASTEVKVLGVPWVATTDTISFQPATNVGSSPPTKRMIAKSLATLFDPLGKLAPLTQRAKMLFRDLCLSKLDWDEVVSDNQHQEFVTVMDSLTRVGEIKQPRFIGLPGGSTYELHTFCDASKSVYASATYIRFVDDSGLVNVQLLMAKARLDPASHPSIPKMELLGLELGVNEVHDWIKKEVQFPEGCKLGRQVIWSDSKVVLAWLQSNKEYGTFVNNRLRSIRNHSEGVEFRYVPSLENPADLATKGYAIDEILDDGCIWWTGPPFLVMDEAFWPITMSDLGYSDGDLHGMAKEGPERVLVMSQTTDEDYQLVDVNRFSNYSKLVRTMVQVMRFIKLISKKKGLDSTAGFKEKGTISVMEVQAAESLLVKQCQKAAFPDLYKDLSSKGPMKNSTVIKLNLKVDDNGLIRSHGRFEHVETCSNPLQLILLPKNDALTSLIIQDHHEKSFHVGTSQTLAELRRKYWVISGHSQVNKVLHRCRVCRRYEGGNYKLPLMPSLPKERVNRCLPFENVGIDAFGPTFVMHGSEKKKTWVYLYTCLTTRLVHLEYVTDLSAMQFLHAFCRFTSLYTVPSMCLCDNATQFKAADRLLKKTVPDPEFNEELMNFMAFRDVKFRYIRSFSPWEGGVYERMIGVVKKVLNKATNRKLLNIDMFRTRLTEVQGVVNRRPLCPLTEDRDSIRVLRPIDFVIPFAKTAMLTVDDQDGDSDPEFRQSGLSGSQKLNELWQEEQKQLDGVWKTFQMSYLAYLRQREVGQHGKQKPSSKFEPAVGDVVIVHDENHSRSLWKMGRIVRLHVGQDDSIRAADVLMTNGRTVSRSVKLLYPLEVKEERSKHEQEQEEEETEEEAADDSTGTPNQQVNIRRSPRLNPLLTMVMCCLAMVSSALASTLMKKGECMKGNHSLRLEDSDVCVPFGYAIYKEHESGKLCWVWVECPKNQHMTKFGICGNECRCPKWATGCTFNSMQPTEDQKVLQHAISSRTDSNICATTSLAVTDKCKPEPVTMALPTIQFADDVTVFVPSLNVEIQQSLPGDYRCLGDGRMTGTPEFCKLHECEYSGTQLCYVKHLNQGFYTENEVNLPIKAWGSKTMTVWQFKESTSLSISCHACEIECTIGGIKVHTMVESSLMEICSTPVCYSQSFPSEIVTFIFSPEITLNDYEVHVKVWSKGVIVFNVYKICPSQLFCETVPYVSWTMIKNWHCAPRWAMLVLFLATWFGGTTSVILFFMVRNIWGSIGILINLLWSFCKYGCRKCRCRKRRNSQEYLPLQANDHVIEMDIDNQRVRYRPTRRMLPIVVACLIMVSSYGQTVTEGCSEVLVTQAEQHECTINGHEMNCSLSQTSEITLATKGQKACLALYDMASRPAGVIEVSVNEISLRCLKTDVFFTRDFEMKTASTKRCPGAGTCQDAKSCDNVKEDTLIDELNGEANSRPGFTGCIGSCACAGCGCFYCTQSCLFYRSYAFPLSDVVYEVFECSEFKLTVELQILLKQGLTVRNRTVILQTGVVTHIWEDLTVTLKSVTTPNTPVINKRFISDGHKIILSETSNAGQPVAGTIGQFQCSSRIAAEQFECVLAHNMCSCEPRRSVVICSCKIIRMEEMFKNSSNLLPLSTGNTLLKPIDNSVQANFEQLSGLQLQITMKNLRLKTLISSASCKIRQVSLFGCYNCITGAKVKLRCFSDQGEVMGMVTCQSLSFTVNCNPTGQWNNITVKIDKSNVEDSCDVRCPGGSTKFKLEGVLHFIPINMLGKVTGLYTKRVEKAQNTFWDFLPDVFLSQYFIGVYMIGSCIAAAIICYVMRRFCA